MSLLTTTTKLVKWKGIRVLQFFFTFQQWHSGQESPDTYRDSSSRQNIDVTYLFW